MTFTLLIDCNNAAFADDLAATLGAIIGTCADQVEEGIFCNSLRDINGNKVAWFKLNDAPEYLQPKGSE